MLGRFFRFIILLLVAFIIAWLGFKVVQKMNAPKEIKEERIYPVIVAHATVGSIEQRLSLTGDINGYTEVSVRPTTMGRVEEIFVDEGDYVKKGAKLISYVAGIKPTDELYEDVVTMAPISGVVGVKNVKMGDQLTAASPSIFTIFSIDRLKIYVDIPEKYYAQVRRGVAALLELDAIPGRVINGVISNIRPVVDDVSRTSQAEIIINNPAHLIRPGMFARVDLILQRKNNAILLPYDALLGMENQYVYVVVGDKAVKRNVRTGMQQGNIIEILTGISPSDKVIINGQKVVDDGVKVKIISQ
jgi:membrane fusion protein, multidrug efflux system